MSDRETESFTPYEPQTSYDWDYGEEPPRNAGRDTQNILWGRLIALGVLALIAFFLGRWSAPNGVDEERLASLRRQANQAEARAEELQAALEAQPTMTPTPAVTVGDQDDTAEDATFDGRTYTVVAGDTLRDIADRFCGDPTQADVIADFNAIADPTLISPGQELKIPEDCGQ